VIAIVFKRYIKKDGKEIGPYYYKNVRAENGQVKSIYLGREKKSIFPALSFKVNIIILLLVIIAIVLYAKPSSFSIRNISLPEKQNLIETDQFLIKQLLVHGDSITRQLKITNLDSKARNIQVSSNLGALVSISDADFALDPRVTKIINIEFITKRGSIEFEPNIYAGKLKVSSSPQEIEVPIIVEVESKNVLFDTNLGIQSYDRLISNNLIVNVNLFNLKTTYPTSVNLEFYVKDFDNNNIITETENIVVETKTSFTKIIKIPENIKPGTYVFSVIAKYGSSTGTSSYIFEVMEPERNIFSIQYMKENPFNFIVILILFLAIFLIASYVYFLIGSSVYYKVKHKEKQSIISLKYIISLLLIVGVIFGLIYKDSIIDLVKAYWPLLLLKLRYAALLAKHESLTLYNYLYPLAIKFYNSKYFSTALYIIEAIFGALIIYGVIKKLKENKNH